MYKNAKTKNFPGNFFCVKKIVHNVHSKNYVHKNVHSKYTEIKALKKMIVYKQQKLKMLKKDKS